ncbi:hypothetical protein OpiT1DRAFT_00759 [Opitutaceae bacterium TAV1]|nr:hypothetical protein OpiT1DRAFT_00759 [Opitutaceae bacterium TAV1]
MRPPAHCRARALALSLFLNLALVVACGWLHLAHRATGPDGQRGAMPVSAQTPAIPTGSEAIPANATNASAPAPAHLVAALAQPDSAVLRDYLLTTDFPPDVVCSLVAAHVQRRYAARFEEHMLRQPPRTGEWWLAPPPDLVDQSIARASGRLALDSEIEAELDRLLANVPRLPSPPAGPRDPASYLSPEKARLVRQIEADYQTPLARLSTSGPDIRLPGDDEKLALLKAEQQRDLAAALTPDELARYEQRSSFRTQLHLWDHFQGFTASDAEFQQLFALQKAHDDAFPTYNSGTREERDAAEKKLNTDIRTALGDERYELWQRAATTDYQLGQAAARRLALPADTADALYALRGSVATTASAVGRMEELNIDERKEAVRQIARETRQKVTALLGEEGAKVYFEKGGMRWLKHLDNGDSVRFDREGSGYKKENIGTK